MAPTAHELRTEPAVEPISTQEAKDQLRITHSTEDTFIDGLILAAREYAENYTRRALINQTWVLFLDQWPAYSQGQDHWWGGVRQGAVTSLVGIRHVELPRSPLSSVTHIKTYSDSDVATTFDASGYIVDTASKPGRVALRQSQSWPTFTKPMNGIEIEYVAGYGEAAGDVPRAIRQAMLNLIAHWYEKRGMTSDEEQQSIAEIPRLVDDLLDRYKVMRL